MSDETAWITEQVNAAKKTNPVPNAVSTQLAELLKGKLSERQLTTAEASTIAGLLIRDMASANEPGGNEKP
jgi:hypothetical protein